MCRVLFVRNGGTAEDETGVVPCRHGEIFNRPSILLSSAQNYVYKVCSICNSVRLRGRWHGDLYVYKSVGTSQCNNFTLMHMLLESVVDRRY